MARDLCLSHVTKIIAEIVLQVILTGANKKLFVCFRKLRNRVSFFVPDNSQGCWIMFYLHFIF